MDNTATTIIVFLCTCLTAYFWYDKNKTDRINEKYQDDNSKAVSELSKKQVEHETKFVTDQRTRDIVQSELKPLREDLATVRSNVNSMMLTLQELTLQLAVQNALREQEKSNNRS